MPKQIWKIDQFHGGLNSSSDPRDIAPSELSGATDVMVDELGKVRMMGGTAAHESQQAIKSNTEPGFKIAPGYGLFYWRHDRVNGSLFSGSATEPVPSLSVHTGINNLDGTASEPMSDWSANFFPNALVGAEIYNVYDGCRGIITSNTGTTVSCDGGMTGGTNNDWDYGDYYWISKFPDTGNDYLAGEVMQMTIECEGVIDYYSMTITGEYLEE